MLPRTCWPTWSAMRRSNAMASWAWRRRPGGRRHRQDPCPPSRLRRGVVVTHHRRRACMWTCTSSVEYGTNINTVSQNLIDQRDATLLTEYAARAARRRRGARAGRQGAQVAPIPHRPHRRAFGAKRPNAYRSNEPSRQNAIRERPAQRNSRCEQDVGLSAGTRSTA